MARESPGYRDQLESIITAFPKGERLTVGETWRIIQAGLAALYQGFSLLKSLMELSLLRAPHLHDYFHRREPRMEIEVKVNITPGSTYGWTTWPAGCAARWTRRSAGW